MKEELILSVDIEADGPIPGPNSMLSFAAAAFTINKKLEGTFSRNLVQLENAAMDPETKAFWDRNPEAWKACRENIVDPKDAFADFDQFLDKFSKIYRITFAAYPVTYDFMWVYWYYHKFLNKMPPFSHSGFDTKTAAALLTQTPFRNISKRKMPKRWMDDFPHTHVALDDALEQGCLTVNIIRESRGLGKIEGYTE